MKGALDRMGEQLELISDGDGLAVVGDPEVVERFLLAHELPSRELALGRLSAKLGTTAAAAQAASQAWAQSGRWVKLTKDSAEKVKRYGLAPTKTKGTSHAMIGRAGASKSWLQIDTRAASQLANPALLSGAAGIMAQVAMQQAMSEIGDYLERIDAKLDDVLRSQKDAALAPMVGTGFLVEEAMVIREARRRVDEVSWSKLHGASAAIAQTQAYALRKLNALADKVGRSSGTGDLVDATGEARSEIVEWLAVLARSVQLRDAIDVLELDRVLDAAPDELDAHRLGLQRAREQRLDRLSVTTDRVLEAVRSAAVTANSRVLTHPAKAPKVVRACGDVSTAIATFHEALRIERSHRHAPVPTRWTEALRDTGDKALATGAEGVDVAKRLGGGVATHARKVGALGQGAGLRAGERARHLRWRRGEEA